MSDNCPHPTQAVQGRSYRKSDSEAQALKVWGGDEPGKMVGRVSQQSAKVLKNKPSLPKEQEEGS